MPDTTFGTSSREVAQAHLDRPVEKVKIMHADDYLALDLEYCESFNIEVTGLYGKGDTTSAWPPSAFLDNDLKDQGFESVNVGWGNWQNGRRILNIELEKDDCHCTVLNKHWDFSIVKDSSLMITEQIICNMEATTNFELE